MKNRKFAVIGLGYFGLNLALRLTEEGAEVIAIDREEAKVEAVKDRVSYAVTLDSTDVRALRKLGLKDMDKVIVAIGENFEGSLLTTAALQEIGVQRIINRVTSPTHERILKLMQVEHLTVPEAEAADKLAHSLMLDGIVSMFELSTEYGVFEIVAPEHFIGRTVRELDLRGTYGMNLVTVKRVERKRGLLTLGEKEIVSILGVPTPDFVIQHDDILVMFSSDKSMRELLGE